MMKHRKRRTTKPGDPPAFLADMNMRGEGVSHDIRDRTSKLDEYWEPEERWRKNASIRRIREVEQNNDLIAAAANAVDRADKTFDIVPVIEFLLQSRSPLPSRAQAVFRDWMKRVKLTRPASRPPTPSHEYTLAELSLKRASERADELKKYKNLSEKQAVKKAADEVSIKKSKLKNYRNGRRGSTRRMDERS
jgi:hypothetical protein